jgi:hypothetical protein
MHVCRSQWPRGLRHRSAAARLLRSWVRISPGAWMFVCCECLCVLSGSGLCDELITRPGESYRLWYVVVCNLETSIMRRPWPALGRRATGKKRICTYTIVIHSVFKIQFWSRNLLELPAHSFFLTTCSSTPDVLHILTRARTPHYTYCLPYVSTYMHNVLPFLNILRLCPLGRQLSQMLNRTRSLHPPQI